MSEYRTLRIRCATEVLRTAVFHGREHLVVPVVALVEGVLHASNSDSPELVLAEEFSKFPSGWNGEPVVLNHPQDEESGHMLSANSPEILEKYQLGTIFGTTVEKKQLRMNAYIDVARAANLGEKAQNLLQKIEENGTIEISVGCFLEAENSSGVYNGQRYARVWRNIVPDHLAFLEEGSIGACSNEAGCGAGISRAAVHVVTKEGFTLEGEPMAENKEDEKVVPRSLRERIRDTFKFVVGKSVEDVSDNDLRRTLDKALRSTEPAYYGIDSVFPADNLVIFSSMPDEKWITYSRRYEVGEDGKVTFSGEKAEVEPVTRFEPVAAEESPTAASCGCGGKKEVSAEGAEGGIKVHKNAERITALIANPKTPWTEQDREYLQSVTDERLATLENHAEPKKEEPVVAAKAETKLEDLPKEWQAAIRSAEEAERKTRGTLIEKLATAQKGFSKEDLDGMSFEQLQKLGKAVLKDANAEPIDFSASAGTRFAAADADEFADDAPDLGVVIRAARNVN